MRNRNQSTFPVLALFLAAALLAVGLAALDLEGAYNIILDGFETRAVDPEGKSQWEIRGVKAKLRGGLYDLEDIRLIVHLESGRQVNITSPHCIFDQARGIASSEAPLKVVSEDMTLAGVGYDLAAARKVLRIRSQVKMTLRKVGSNLSPADVFGTFDPTRQAPGETAPDSKEEKK